MTRSSFTRNGFALAVVAGLIATSCGSNIASKQGVGATSTELEEIQGNLAATYSAEEAFSFQNLEELSKRSAVSLVVTIEKIEPGPAEIMAELADGQVVVNETLAITLSDNNGNRHQLIQDYGEAFGFDAVASEFPIGATAVLFGVPYTLPENRRTPDEFHRSDSVMWQLAHPLAFLVLSKDKALVPLFSEYNSAPKASIDDDIDYLRTIGLEAAEIRWPEVAHG